MKTYTIPQKTMDAVVKHIETARRYATETHQSVGGQIVPIHAMDDAIEMLRTVEADAVGVTSLTFDYMRVRSWALDPNRKRAYLAFTAGPDREAAYLIEDVQRGVGQRIDEITMHDDSARSREIRRATSAPATTIGIVSASNRASDPVFHAEYRPLYFDGINYVTQEEALSENGGGGVAPHQKAALALLREYEKTEARYHSINLALESASSTDFPARVPAIDDTLLQSVVALLDAVLGENLASYYLWECSKKGKITLPGGWEFHIRSVDDIETYLKATTE